MGQIKTKLNCKFETVELTFQFKTAYEFSKIWCQMQFVSMLERFQ